MAVRSTLVRVMVAAITSAMLGCGLYGRRGEKVSAPATPIALVDLNTIWDDFNAAKPLNWQGLVYSTNRGSAGRDFDAWWAEVAWGEVPSATLMPRPFSPDLMSPANERGPLLVDGEAWGVAHPVQTIFVVASDRPGGQGGLDLYWAGGCGRNGHACDGRLAPLAGLNSPANDAYLSLPFAGRRALFASDRSGAGYDLYEATWAPGGALSEPPASVRRLADLSSDAADDEAPYVFEGDGGIPEVVFVSDRPGGRGGRDLLCARLDGTRWRTPASLAAPINSPADEYRPSVFVVSGARFLVFSSNRPGGAGGYDLYAVRYPGCPAGK